MLLEATITIMEDTTDIKLVEQFNNKAILLTAYDDTYEHQIIGHITKAFVEEGSIKAKVMCDISDLDITQLSFRLAGREPM